MEFHDQALIARKDQALIARKSALEKTQLSDVLITDNSTIETN